MSQSSIKNMVFYIFIIVVSGCHSKIDPPEDEQLAEVAEPGITVGSSPSDTAVEVAEVFLESLSFSVGSLEPSFSPDNTHYQLVLDYTIDSLKVSARPSAAASVL